MPIDVSEQHRLLMPMSFHHMRLRRNEQADAGYGLQHRQQFGTYQPLMASTPMTPEGRLLSATLVPRLTARRHQAAPLLSVLGRRIRTRADGPTLRRTLCAIDKSIQPATWLAIRVVSPELFADPFDRLQQS